MVKTFLFLTLSLGLGIANATVPASKVSHSVEFTLSPHFDLGHKVYYSCSSAEDQIEMQMERMGATNVDVRCTGGLDDFRPEFSTPAFISMTYDVLKSNAAGNIAADWKTVKANSYNNCFMMTQLFKQVAHTFEMQNVKVSGHCMNPDSPFRLKFTGLFAQ